LAFLLHPGLAPKPNGAYLIRMSNKQLITDLLERMPENASLQDIAQEIQFMAGVREGLGQLDRGEGAPIEFVEKMIASWTTR
jgi:hypothetical protein